MRVREKVTAYIYLIIDEGSSFRREVLHYSTAG